MSHSQFHSIDLFILRHAWLNLWDKRMLLAESTRLLSRLVVRLELVSHNNGTSRQLVNKHKSTGTFTITYITQRKYKHTIALASQLQSRRDWDQSALAGWNSITHSFLPYLASFPETRRWSHAYWLQLYRIASLEKWHRLKFHHRLTQSLPFNTTHSRMIFSLFVDKPIGTSERIN